MSPFSEPLNLDRVRVYPIEQKRSLNQLERTLVDPRQPAPPLPEELSRQLSECVERIRAARASGAGVILMYGAHLIKNGLMAVVNGLLAEDALTHLATNGAGIIHDWEFAYAGRTEESVRANVATGSFGTWDETGRAIMLASLKGALRNEGFGRSMGGLIADDGVELPQKSDLEQLLRAAPAHELAPARAELLRFMDRHNVQPGTHSFLHPNKQTSILWEAYRRQVPLTVHPGIGYDIYCTHPWFNGAAIGRAAGLDFAQFGRAVDSLDGGVVLSVGSAIMAPQVFEKSLSVVNNLRLQSGRPTVFKHTIYVVDIQDGGNWDWSKGEPPKDNPAYYLRFCKSYARMGGDMRYVQCDNRLFLHNLLWGLRRNRV